MNAVTNKDSAKRMAAQVTEAFAAKKPLAITGSGSKAFLVNAAATGSDALSLAGHSGILSYEPTELVVSARAGTSIQELRDTLAEKGQHLPFDPPVYAGTDTLGGVIACGVSGPARPYSGAARDFVLGTRLINGKGEILKFGGEVMKNVAGYDVSRLQVGACGSLGVLLDVSLKVLPQMQSRETRCFEMRADEAIPFLEKLARKPLPLAAACVLPANQSGQNGQSDIASEKVDIRVRLAGSDAAVKRAGQDEGGEVLAHELAFWDSLRDLTHTFFKQTGDDKKGARLWRVTVPASLPIGEFVAALPKADLQDCLFDWGGSLRWVKSGADGETMRAAVAGLHGQVTGCGPIGGNLPGERRPLQQGSATLGRLQRSIKNSFDPAGILNAGVFGYD